MDSNTTSRAAAALERLFRAYPQPDKGDIDAAVRERVERAKIYLEAISIYDIRDIEAAVSSFITGSAPGWNPSFLPQAPLVAAETRRLMNLRVDSEARERARRPALPPPDVERSPESRARVAAMVAQVVGALQVEQDDGKARHKAQLDRTNAYFDPPRAFSIGDPDGEADAA